MPPKTTLNVSNLEALGAERLAALPIEVSEGNAAVSSSICSFSARWSVNPT
jgi:hypothetical protein